MVLREGKEMLIEEMRKDKDHFHTCFKFLLCTLPRRRRRNRKRKKEEEEREEYTKKKRKRWK